MTERRQHWPTMQDDPEFWVRLETHIKKEEERFDAGDKRMVQIEQDLQPLKKMYYAIVGSGGVAALLLMTLLYIYSSDKGDLKEMQQVLYRQGNAIEKLLIMQNALEQNYRRDLDRIDRERKH